MKALTYIILIVLLSGCLPIPAKKIDKIEFWQGDYIYLTDSARNFISPVMTFEHYMPRFRGLFCDTAIFDIDSMKVYGMNVKPLKRIKIDLKY
jgi:hypothetical protein